MTESMGQLSDWLIVSDVDGTLVMAGDIMPARNRDAINRFVAKGGRFAIASGRSFGRIAHFFDEININAPCVLLNGGAIYNAQTEEYWLEMTLPEHAKAYIDVLARAPVPNGLGVINRTHYCGVGADITLMNQLFAKRKQSHLHVPRWQDLTGDWFKVLMVVPKECQEEALAYVDAQNFDGVRFTLAEAGLLEMIPAQSSKGYALEQLMEKIALKPERLAVVGDYYNDLEMLDLAGLAAVPNDAPADVQSHAHLVTCSCADGAVADVIEYLEKHCR